MQLKTTQHLKCDCTVTHEYFCTKLCSLHLFSRDTSHDALLLNSKFHRPQCKPMYKSDTAYICITRYCTSSPCIFKHVRTLLEHNSILFYGHLKPKETSLSLKMCKDRRITFTTHLPGFTCSNLSYKERLNKLNLVSLELRRFQFDLIMCYKIIFGLDRLHCEDFSSLVL